jgi:hypothetical protein
MEKEVRRHKKINLALAVAEGESIAAWARENGVPERTAQRWAQDRNVRREVDACRSRALNQAFGRLTGMAMNAVDGIAHLAQGAESESVQRQGSISRTPRTGVWGRCPLFEHILLQVACDPGPSGTRASLYDPHKRLNPQDRRNSPVRAKIKFLVRALSQVTVHLQTDKWITACTLS